MSRRFQNGTSRKEDRRLRLRLVDVQANRYGIDRLVHFLRLLRPAPHGWVIRAQRIGMNVGVLTDRDMAELERKLESDPEFRGRFDSDPVTAVEDAGMRELALRLKWEARALVALAERIANDDAFRGELHADPAATLLSARVPAEAAEPLLQVLAVPDDVLTKLPDVVAHRHEQQTTVRLHLLLLGTTSVVEKLRASSTDT